MIFYYLSGTLVWQLKISQSQSLDRVLHSVRAVLTVGQLRGGGWLAALLRAHGRGPAFLRCQPCPGAGTMWGHCFTM